MYTSLSTLYITKKQKHVFKERAITQRALTQSNKIKDAAESGGGGRPKWPGH